MPNYTATYSPDDNKLRLYSIGRLDPETYARVRAAGFIWAPKQGLFVAPMWTPSRADLLVELAGEIGDEDTSLVERAEERADRFTDYHAARLDDAHSARTAVERITSGIPMGQPILVGHHSERHARKDAERIENGMRKAIKAWETAQYWRSRAAGAINHAKYKERPDVRARRIKGIEADKRKRERQKAEAGEIIRKFALVDDLATWKPRDDGTIPTRQERARFIAGRLSGGPYCAVVQTAGPNVTTLRYSAYDVLAPDDQRYSQCPAMTVDQVMEKFTAWKASTDAYCDRWIEHYNFRLEYERAMLAESGGLITDRTEYPIVPGGRVLVRREWLTVIRVNRKDGQIVSVTTNDRYVRVKGIEEVQDYQPPTDEAAKAVKGASKLPPIINEDLPGCVHLLKAEFDARRKHTNTYGYRVVRAAGEFAAYRQAYGYRGGSMFSIFFPDQKIKPRPLADETIERPTLPPPERATSDTEEAARLRASNDRRDAERAESGPYAALRESLRGGVQVVSAPQLFPTPAHVARQMIELADIDPGNRVLEPSAGTGVLLDAIQRRAAASQGVEVLAVEINLNLVDRLRAITAHDPAVRVLGADFLACNSNLGTFDRVVMNPPFQSGSDIAHILHARSLLNPGGRLVAICANGPRQQERLQPLADAWIDLPDGTFAETGTNVRTAIVVMGAA